MGGNATRNTRTDTQPLGNLPFPTAGEMLNAAIHLPFLFQKPVDGSLALFCFAKSCHLPFHLSIGIVCVQIA